MFTEICRSKMTYSLGFALKYVSRNIRENKGIGEASGIKPCEWSNVDNG